LILNVESLLLLKVKDMSLYKYLVPERIDVLCNAKIRFSQHMALNDPFEMKPYFEGLTSESVLTEFFNASWQAYGADALKVMDTLIPDILKDEHYKASMEQSKHENPAIELLLNTHKERMPELRNVIFTSFNDEIGVLCLTEERDNLIMWAHYANNYKGFVIEFDEKHEFFQQKDTSMLEHGCIRQVRYSEDRPNHASFTDLTRDELFFLKSKGWTYEREWRMLKPLPIEDSDKVRQDADGQPVYLFSFPPECVTSIIFGSRMPDVVRKNFLELLTTDHRYSDLKAFQATLDEKKFRLIIEPI
jgi:hypothetical protein